MIVHVTIHGNTLPEYLQGAGPLVSPERTNHSIDVLQKLFASGGYPVFYARVGYNNFLEESLSYEKCKVFFELPMAQVGTIQDFRLTGLTQAKDVSNDLDVRPPST